MKRLALLLWAAGCGSPRQEWVPVHWLDPAVFRRDVEPVLEAKCGNPACHGRAERPLSVYAPYAWRADPRRTFLHERLTDEEIEHNYVSACVLATPARSPGEALLVTKPLAQAAGIDHGGGAVFEGSSDRGYRVLYNWLAAGWKGTP